MPSGQGAQWNQLADAIVAAADRLGLELDHRARAVARVLAVRHLVQAALTSVIPTTDVRRLGVGVDALHAVSMVGLAEVDPPHRRLALTDAAVATAFAVTGRRAPSACAGRPPVLA